MSYTDLDQIQLSGKSRFYSLHFCEVAEWSNDEKRLLLEALNKHGPTKIEAIANEIPMKSITDIQVMITRYERVANYDPAERLDKDSAIDKWIEILLKFTDYNELVPISKALKYIALFEERTEVTDYDINLRSCYELLADASEGIAPKQLNENSAIFLFQTLLKEAKEVKRGDITKHQEFLNNFKLNANSNARVAPTYTYGKKSKRTAEDDISINPLKVPKEMCKKLKN